MGQAMRDKTLSQINCAIQQIEQADSKNQLTQAHQTAMSFIESAFESEHINQKERSSFEMKARRAYRNQLVGEAAIKHPCQDQCPNYIDEQCCHCLIQIEKREFDLGLAPDDFYIKRDEQVHLDHALTAMEHIP